MHFKFWTKNDLIKILLLIHIFSIENYRFEYFRFSILIAAQNSFHFCRRFINFRVCLFLLKQNRLSVLKKKFDQIDFEKKNVLFFQNCRRDVNEKRKFVFIKIDVALMNYDIFFYFFQKNSSFFCKIILTQIIVNALIKKNHRMFKFEIVNSRDVMSLQNWVNNNFCLIRNETAYLTRCKKLLSVMNLEDDIFARMKIWIENKLIQFYKNFDTTMIQISIMCFLSNL